MRLITELHNNIQTRIDEAEGHEPKGYIEGIFAQAELKNRNSRIYPHGILAKSIQDYINEYVSTNRALGEINHPPRPNVDPENACIIIESLTWDGNNVMGRARCLSTPKGQLLQALIKDGVQLGVSTRGLGSVRHDKKTGVDIVEDDYVIKAIDCVHNPSGIDCFVNGILENVEYYYSNGVLCEREIERIEENIKKNDIGAIKSDFSKFMNSCFK